MFSSDEQLGHFRPSHFAQLKHMAVFAVVVDAGSFTKAGKRLGIAKSAVSRYVSELERSVGVPLLRRTTRRLYLTEPGERFFAECARMVGSAITAMDAIQPDQALMGSMRVAATLGHGEYVVVPALHSFMALHPQVSVHLDLSDDFIDLVENGIDLSLRVGSRGPTPQYISRKVGDMRYRLYATPAFIDDQGGIATPEDAARLPWVLGHRGTDPSVWTFCKDEQRTEIHVKARLTVSNIVARAKAAAMGMGLIGLPDFMPPESFGRDLVEVLSDYRIEPDIPIYAVYPSAQFVSPRVSEFLAHLGAFDASAQR